MKSFKSYLKEYGTLDPFQPMGGSSSGPGMGQYVPTADLNLRASRAKQAVNSRGKVALLSAIVDVLGTPPGMFATQ